MDEEQWGDYRDWEHWQQRSAAQVAQDICKRNGGQWPSNVKEWEEAASLYGFLLFIVDDLPKPAMTIDDCIFIRYSRRPAILNRRICHEIAEAITLGEGGIRSFHFVSERDEYHHVAHLVEVENTRLVRERIAKSEQRAAKLEKQFQLIAAALEAERATIQAGRDSLIE